MLLPAAPWPRRNRRRRRPVERRRWRRLVRRGWRCGLILGDWQAPRELLRSRTAPIVQRQQQRRQQRCCRLCGSSSHTQPCLVGGSSTCCTICACACSGPSSTSLGPLPSDSRSSLCLNRRRKYWIAAAVRMISFSLTHFRTTSEFSNTVGWLLLLSTDFCPVISSYLPGRNHYSDHSGCGLSLEAWHSTSPR